jgi:hypothetical protein
VAINYDTVPRLANGTPILHRATILKNRTGGPACCDASTRDSFGVAVPSTFWRASNPLGPANFVIMHVPLTDPGKTALATEDDVALGLAGVLLELNVNYYAEAERPQSTDLATGLNRRIASSRVPRFANDNPTLVDRGPQSPPTTYHATNPRIFVIGVQKTNTLVEYGSTPSCTECDRNGLSGRLQLGEFLAFYLEFVLYTPGVPGDGFTLGGYFVRNVGVPGATGWGPPGQRPGVMRLTR